MNTTKKTFWVIAVAAIIGLSMAACSGPSGGGGGLDPIPGPPPYSIGDTGPGKGIIFYYDPAGFTVEGYGKPGDAGYFASYTAHYLELAPSDSGTAAWGADGEGSIGVTHIYNEVSAPELLVKIGNGRKDTQLIVAYLTQYPESPDRAAQLAIVPQGGQSDWFLPSMGELVKLNISGVSGFSSGLYWTSSQQSSYYAWAGVLEGLELGVGGYSAYSKLNSYAVRAIRAF